MSRMVIFGNPRRGWEALFEGEDETPLASASTAMTKSFDVSTILSGPLPKYCSRSLDVPVNQAGNSNAFDLPAFSAP